MQWYLAVWKNYLGFEGRASRTEYWMFILFNMIVAFLLMVLGNVARWSMFLLWIYEIAVFLPALAVQVRRLHDIGRSGWWVFIALVPLVGAIVLFVFDVLPSENGANRYGQEPVTGSASGPLQF